MNEKTTDWNIYSSAFDTSIYYMNHHVYTSIHIFTAYVCHNMRNTMLCNNNNYYYYTTIWNVFSETARDLAPHQSNVFIISHSTAITQGGTIHQIRIAWPRDFPKKRDHSSTRASASAKDGSAARGEKSCKCWIELKCRRAPPFQSKAIVECRGAELITPSSRWWLALPVSHFLLVTLLSFTFRGIGMETQKRSNILENDSTSIKENKHVT